MLIEKRKILFVLLFILMFTLVFSLMSFAATQSGAGDGGNGGSGGGRGTSVSIPIPDADSFIAKGKAQDGEGAIRNSADSVAVAFIPILQTIGNILIILSIMITGIKWLYAGPRERATLKEKMWAYVVGIAVVFCGLNMTALVTNYLEQI